MSLKKLTLACCVIGILTVLMTVAAKAQGQQSPTNPNQRPRMNNNAQRAQQQQQFQRQLQQQRQQRQGNNQNNQDANGESGPSLFGSRDQEAGDENADAPAPRRGGGTVTGQGSPAPNLEIIQGGNANTGGTVRVQGGIKEYRPYRDREVVYKDLPDVGEVMDIKGPSPASQFLDDIAFATGWNILPTQEVLTIPLNYWITGLKPNEAIKILQFHDIYYEYEPKTKMLYVMTVEQHLDKKYGDLTEAQIRVKHADVADIEAVLSNYLSPEGRLITEPRTSTIYVQDTEDNVERMRKITTEIDVPLQTQVFHLVYLDVELLTDALESYISEVGVVQADSRLNTVTVMDVPSRLNRIEDLVQNLDKQLETRSWFINEADPETIAENISMLVPEEMGVITVNEDIHQITVTALPERLDEIEKLINQWDLPRRQVSIEAYIVSVGSTVARNLGINWSYFTELDNRQLVLGNGPFPQNPREAEAGQTISVGQLPHPNVLRNLFTGNVVQDVLGNDIVRGFQGDTLAAAIDYLDSNGDLTIISHPRVTVQDGEEALFENTSQVPFVSSSNESPRSQVNNQGQFVNSFRNFNRIEFIDVGTILRVLPRISERDNILLEVSAEDSTFVFREVIGNDQTSTVPEKTQSRAETLVQVHDGDTIVIGGLRSANIGDNVEKVPVLGDIPLLGRLFRNTKKDHAQRELLIFITTTVVDIGTSPESIRIAKVDENLADVRRDDKRGTIKRALNKVVGGRQEIAVSIGQSGTYYSEGDSLTLEELQERIRDSKGIPGGIVLIRHHSRAPKEAINAVIDTASQAELKVEFDDHNINIFVPNKSEKGSDDIGQPEEAK